MRGRRARKGGFVHTLPDGSRRVSWRIWVLIWVTPLLFLGAAAFLALQVVQQRQAMVETTGTVVKVYEWESTNPFDEGPYVYGPVFRYTWTDGTETEASTGTSSSLQNYPVGTEMTIRYNPDAKDNVVIVGPSEWMVARVIAIIGLVLAIPSILASLLIWRWQRRTRPEATA